MTYFRARTVSPARIELPTHRDLMDFWKAYGLAIISGFIRPVLLVPLTDRQRRRMSKELKARLQCPAA